jgi:uncharacterized protein YjbI with pentapeptide repeats
MANEEHLKILKRGIDHWNEWRRKNPELQPDLMGVQLNMADLRRLDLRQTDLRYAQLGRVDLNFADLSRADLSGADLRRAKARSAQFREAQLSRANFSSSDLCLADLSRAIIEEANFVMANLSTSALNETLFRGTNLSGAELHDCSMHKTVLANLDLSTVKGLKTVRHLGPSEISISTIYRSGANIPEVFLRGTGIPEPFITHSKALVSAMSPVEFYSCFVSYSNQDEDFAKRLHADLQDEGVRCWFAPEDLKIGDPFRQRIDEAIRLHDKLMIVLSENSIKSSWVESEVETAFEKEEKQNRMVLFPIRLDESVMRTDMAWAAHIRRTRHIGNFCKWKDHDSYKEGFTRLLRDLKSESETKSVGQGRK